ncbi:MAG: serine hydrolase domain-containing protein [Planctomycetota bacterium]
MPFLLPVRSWTTAALALVSTLAIGDDTTSEERTRLVQDTMTRNHIPGIAVAVTLGGERPWILTLGQADLENGVAVSQKTFFRFASVSKPITATATMKMVERGELLLDETVGQAWPEAHDKYRRMTLRHLLCHQSGLRHHQPIAWNAPLRHYKTLQSRIDDDSNAETMVPTGERFAYTTFGYTIVGRVMEAASKDDFAHLVDRHVFGPAGMKSAQVCDIYTITPNRASGYFRGIDGRLRNSAPFDPSGKRPGGGLGGTIEDLSSFLVELWKGTLLRDSTRQRMWTPQRLNDGSLTDYGLGWHVSENGSLYEVFHTGSQPQVSSVVLIRPTNSVTVAILCNLEQVNLLGLARRLADSVVTAE